MTPADVKAHWLQELERAVWGKVGNTLARDQLRRMEAFIDAILSQPGRQPEQWEMPNPRQPLTDE
jgi:hypothetical protein